MRKLCTSVPAYASTITTNFGTIGYSAKVVRCSKPVAELVNDLWSINQNLKVPIY